MDNFISGTSISETINSVIEEHDSTIGEFDDYDPDILDADELDF